MTKRRGSTTTNRKRQKSAPLTPDEEEGVVLVLETPPSTPVVTPAPVRPPVMAHQTVWLPVTLPLPVNTALTLGQAQKVGFVLSKVACNSKSMRGLLENITYQSRPAIHMNVTYPTINVLPSLHEHPEFCVLQEAAREHLSDE